MTVAEAFVIHCATRLTAVERARMAGQCSYPVVLEAQQALRDAVDALSALPAPPVADERTEG